MQKTGKFDVKVSVTPNGLEEYVAFTINKNLVFINSMEFMISSLDALVKNLLGNDFKYLFQECNGIELELISDNDMHLFIEKEIRGGVSYIAKKRSKANNK